MNPFLDRDVLITGWGHSVFGKLEASLEDLVVAVGAEAIDAAGLAPADIDAVFVGNFNSGLVPLAFPSSLALQISPDLFGVPATRVENACASGSAAVHQGVHSILAGMARHVLVVGADKMTHAAPSEVGAALLGADYDMAGRTSVTGFAGLFAEVASVYERRYGGVGDALGSIAAKNHRNGVGNPYAQIRKDLGEEFCRTVSERNPIVASPLRRTDCSPVSDGAAAVVLSRSPNGAAATSPVRFLGLDQANDFLPGSGRDPVAFKGTERAWARAMQMAGATLADLAMQMAGATLADLDFAEVHDCFTIAELIAYEAIGLTPPGQGRRAIQDGVVAPGGSLPINLSGGLKAKGHPVGATGVSQHVMAAKQLTGTAGVNQLPSAALAAVHNMGGLAVANYVSVLSATD